jgi:hypothetical protein
MTDQQIRQVFHAAPTGGVFTRGEGWHLQAVFGPDGALQLFDIYIENHWQGSRRTEKQCHGYLRQQGLVDIPEYL